MTRRLTTMTALTTSVLVLALGACGSSKTSLTPSGGGSSATSKGGGSSATSKGGGSSATSKGGLPNDNSTLAAILGKAKTAKYKVTYKTDNGDDTTIVNDPPRAAFISKDSGLYQEANGKTVTCEGTGSSATCTEAPASAGGVGSVATMVQAMLGTYSTLLTSGAGMFAGIQTSSRTIAGRPAVCAKINESKYLPGKKGSVEICADKELGLTLSVTSTDENGKASAPFTATSVSTSVSDADVTPPVTPVTAP